MTDFIKLQNLPLIQNDVSAVQSSTNDGDSGKHDARPDDADPQYNNLQ